MIEPLVHILIPVFNQKEFLEESISSALNQTYKNIRVLLINDGSTENIDEILEKFKSDKRLETFSQKNQGLAYTLNKLGEISKSSNKKPEFVTWHSADNIFEANAITEMVNFLINNQQYDMVFANVALINEKSELIFNSKYRKDDQTLNNTAFLNLNYPFQSIYQCNDNFINACFLLRNSTEEIIPPYQNKDKGFEDYIHWLQLSLIGNASHIEIKEPLYKYRLHSQSLTKDLENKNLSILQRQSVKKTNFIHDQISNYDFVYNITTNSFIKRKKSFNIFGLSHYLEKIWDGEACCLEIDDSSVIRKQTKLHLSLSPNAHFSNLNLYREIFRIPPFLARLESIEHEISREFYFEGITKDLSFLERSRNRNTGMFSSNEDSLYKEKLLILVPSSISDNYISQISNFILKHKDKLFVLFAFGALEKTIADQIYLACNTEKNIRIVERTLAEELTKDSLIHCLSSIDCIISNSIFNEIAYVDAKIELILSALSLKPCLVSEEFSYHTDSPLIRILDTKNDYFTFSKVDFEKYQNSIESFVLRAKDQVNLIKLVANLFIDSIS